MTLEHYVLPEMAHATLVERVIALFDQAIKARRLAPGHRVPSIRKLASELAISPFTVTDAYQRLVARGLLESRRGSGYFVAGGRPVSAPADPPPVRELAIDAYWLSRNVYESGDMLLPVGGGWLPSTWFDAVPLARALRALARDGMPTTRYGQPQGWLPLREHIADRLGDAEITASPRDIVLTHGASQAIDLAAAVLARPGDTVLVDDPGYCNLISCLQLRGLNVIGAPWTPQGPDLAELARLAALHRPRAFFTNPWLQNPTGCSYAPATAFGVLRLAGEFDFTVVEDNVSADFVSGRQTPLAAQGGLGRVMYIGSFSKTLSPALRVGFVATDRARADELANVKMITGLTSSEYGERMVLSLLEDGSARRQVERLRVRLAEAQPRARARLEAAGYECFGSESGGMFIWARRPGHDPVTRAEHAGRAGVLLAPGRLFRPGQTGSEWLRVNAAYCLDERLDGVL
ncbi:MAG: PLP-dependent aminotransferase family protein [Microvirgula sp.]